MEGSRRATAGDAGCLLRLWEAATDELRGQRGGQVLLRQLGLDRPSLGAVEKVLGGAAASEGHQLVLVGTFDDQVVGAAWVVSETLAGGYPLAVLRALYVEAPARGVGIGARLMTSVLAWCQERGCHGLDGYALPGDRRGKGFFEGHHLTARLLTMHRSLL